MVVRGQVCRPHFADTELEKPFESCAVLAAIHS
jgi:hypothetical protein